MDSNLESVARTRKKQDPAWNHCEKIKDGARVELKCIYCGKVFKGGGIYRFKEHLAGQKGNGATCSKVHPDIRLQMLEVLIGSSSKKKKKKPKLAAEMAAYGDSKITGTEVANNGSGLNVDENVHVPVYDISGFEVANNTCGFDSEGNAHVSPCNIPPLSEVEVAKSNCYLNSHGIMDASGDREDGMSGKKSARKKKGRVTKTLDVDVVDLNIEVPPGYPALNSKKKVSVVDMAIGRFFFDVGLPADAVNSAYFQPMLDAIASQGAGVVGPSYYDLRSWILKNSVHEVRYDVEQCTSAWGRTGCSILVYEWSSKKCKTFINLFAYSPEGTIFLRSADISHAIDAADFLYELLKETVEQVGLNNVVQVVTTGEERYVIAGKRLTDTYPTIFWTPCAGYCIDLMLQDVGELPEVKMILNQAKSISSYIYSDTATINMIRRYTSGVDLVDLGTTRSSTDFMTLKRMLNVRQNLQSMVTSEEWMGSYCSEKAEGIAVLDSLCSQSFWSTCASVVRLTDPILHLLKLVDSQKMPSMGFVYAGLYRVKEAIKKELLDSGDYLVYWSIIDHRWEQLERHPLHAAGFYLNPKHFNSLEEDGHHHIRSLVFDCIEKLVTDPNIQDKIMRERASYLSCKGDFGRKMAIRSRDTILPSESSFWFMLITFCISYSATAKLKIVSIVLFSCPLVSMIMLSIKINSDPRTAIYIFMHEELAAILHMAPE